MSSAPAARGRAKVAAGVALALLVTSSAAAQTPVRAPSRPVPVAPPAVQDPAPEPLCDSASEVELRENLRRTAAQQATATPRGPSRDGGRGALRVRTVQPEQIVGYLRALEPRRAAVLYQVRAGPRLCSWLVSAKGTASHLAQVDPDALAAMAGRVTAATAAGGTAAAAALRGASALVFPPPIAEKLLGERVDTLVVAPIAELEALPYPALPIGLAALVDVAAVQIAPGLEAFARSPAQAKRDLGTAVVLSGPGPAQGLAPTPDAEAAAVARMFRTTAGSVWRVLRAAPIVGPVAMTASRFVDTVSRAAASRLDVLYVSARAGLDAAGVPGLSLADRRLTESEIGRLPLRDARPIVVLAPEEERPGADAAALPLARAFSRAGASAVATSLSGPGAASDAGLVTRFLSESTTAPPDAALRTAMLAARAERREPASWARLALVGVPQLPGSGRAARRPCVANADCGPGGSCVGDTCRPREMALASASTRCFGEARYAFDENVFNSPSRDTLRDIATCVDQSSNYRVRVVAPSRRRLDAFVQSLVAFGVPRGRILAEGGAAACDGEDPEVCRRVELRGEHVTGAAPTAGEPSAAETLRMVRYPSVQAPALMKPRQTHAVIVSLAERRETPTIVEGPGGVASAGGDVTVEVPRTPDLPEEEAWRVRVDLTMPDAEVNPPSGELLLRVDGSGVPASFTVRPTWTPAVPSERRETPLLAVFSRDGKVFARALRMITVTADPAVSASASGAGLVQGGAPEAEGRPADLYVQVLTLPRAGDAAAGADRVIVSAKLRGEPGLATDMGVRMDGLDAFLVERYARLSGLAARGVSVLPASPEARAASAQVAAAALRQLGQDLWDRYTPPVLRDKIRVLQGELARGADVRIQTNDPRVPWELLLVPVDGKGDCAAGAKCELLGVLHRVSRWHVGSALGVNPDVRTREGVVAVVAPNYDTPLGGVLLEREALARFGDRVRPVAGRFEPLLGILAASPAPAVLHYAGHGEARPGVLEGMERFGLSLEDRLVDVDTFRQHAAWRTAERGVGPLVFLNACDVGRAAGVYGFVEGWGPAALERGAAGFIGGLWPLGDSGAAEFSRRFYEAAMAGKGVAEAVRAAREGYATSGDPTYAAYVFYGHPDLRLAAPR